MTAALRGLTRAILGGDEQVREIARLARAASAPPVPLTAEAARPTAGGHEWRAILRILRAEGIARGSEA